MPNFLSELNPFNKNSFISRFPLVSTVNQLTYDHLNPLNRNSSIRCVLGNVSSVVSTNRLLTAVSLALYASDTAGAAEIATVVEVATAAAPLLIACFTNANGSAALMHQGANSSAHQNLVVSALMKCGTYVNSTFRNSTLSDCKSIADNFLNKTLVTQNGYCSESGIPTYMLAMLKNVSAAIFHCLPSPGALACNPTPPTPPKQPSDSSFPLGLAIGLPVGFVCMVTPIMTMLYLTLREEERKEEAAKAREANSVTTTSNTHYQTEPVGDPAEHSSNDDNSENSRMLSMEVDSTDETSAFGVTTM